MIDSTTIAAHLNIWGLLRLSPTVKENKNVAAIVNRAPRFGVPSLCSFDRVGLRYHIISFLTFKNGIVGILHFGTVCMNICAQ